MTTYDVRRLIVTPFRPGDLHLFEPVERIDRERLEPFRQGVPAGQCWTAFVKESGAAIAVMGLYPAPGVVRAWGAMAAHLPVELVADLLRAARMILAQEPRQPVLAHAENPRAERFLARLGFEGEGHVWPKKVERRA